MMKLASDFFIKCNKCGSLMHISRHRLEAYVSSYDHGEYGMGAETDYEIESSFECSFCNNPITFNIYGSEYPEGAFDSTSAEIEGASFIKEPTFEMDYSADAPFHKQNQAMLLESVVNTCNDRFKKSMEEHHPCSNGECTHDCGHMLQGVACSCINCLEEVHFHKSEGRKTYNCPNLVNCYTCRYSNKFASEIGYALRELPCLKAFDDYRILSIGCGPAPDLMAFEKFRQENGISARIQYHGFDLNQYWWTVHDLIGKYCDNPNSITARFHYMDAIKVFAGTQLPEANVLILQYVISHFHNTDQFDQLQTFFENITDNIISKMKEHSVVIIHDINHYLFGRDNFEDLRKYLRSRGIKGRYHKRYFDNGIVNEHQRYGAPYPSIRLLYPPTPQIRNDYCKSNNECSGAALLIELGGES